MRGGPASHLFTLSITFFQFLSFLSLPSSGNVTKFIFFIFIYEAKVLILEQTVINQLWLILRHPPCCCNIFIQTYTTFTLWKQQYMNKRKIIVFLSNYVNKILTCIKKWNSIFVKVRTWEMEHWMIHNQMILGPTASIQISTAQSHIHEHNIQFKHNMISVLRKTSITGTKKIKS